MADKNYMPEAVGLTSGNRGDDVRRLQAYLGKFGYLETPALAAFETPRLAAVAAEAGVFDDKTAQALRRYQALQRLPVTGELDDATLSHMGQPRCGFPDVAEFALTGRRWPTANLTYGFQNVSRDLTEPQVKAAIESAFRLWEAFTPLRFTERPVADRPDIIIRFVAGEHGDFDAFDGAGGVLAHAFFPPLAGSPVAQPIQGDAHFDEDENWSVARMPPFGSIDLVTVATHEIGHSLGLGHSDVRGALMFPTYSGPHRFLSRDDIAGIQALYGPRR